MDWLTITGEEFMTYQMTPHLQKEPSDPLTRSQVQQSQQQLTVGQQRSELAAFKKGIKRDATLFPTLKDERYQDSWHRQFEIQIKAQDLDDIIDPNYKPNPSDPDEVQLFKMKQTFVYSVLERVVQTSKGKSIMRDTKDFDAQSAYARIKKHHTDSSVGDIAAQQIQAYFTTSAVGDGKFQGTVAEYINHFVGQYDVYKCITGTTLLTSQKLDHLARAVSSIPALRQVKETGRMLSLAMGKANIDYEKYLSLLQEAAINYDNALKNKPRRTVYEHRSIFEDAWDPYAFPEYEVNFHEMGSDDNFQCDVDTPVGVLEAYAHERTICSAYKQQQYMAGSRMHWEAWRSLSPEAQKI
jgi:hypothetical protein